MLLWADVPFDEYARAAGSFESAAITTRLPRIIARQFVLVHTDMRVYAAAQRGARDDVASGIAVTDDPGIHDRPEPVDRGKTGFEDPCVVRSCRPAALGRRVRWQHQRRRRADTAGEGGPAGKSRRGPRGRKPAALHADNAYDQADLRTWLRDQGIAVRIARKAIESSAKPGKRCWVIERSLAWLFGYHQLTIRYGRYTKHFCAFLTLAATLTCYKKLVTPAT